MFNQIDADYEAKNMAESCILLEIFTTAPHKCVLKISFEALHLAISYQLKKIFVQLKMD